MNKVTRSLVSDRLISDYLLHARSQNAGRQTICDRLIPFIEQQLTHVPADVRITSIDLMLSDIDFCTTLRLKMQVTYCQKQEFSRILKGQHGIENIIDDQITEAMKRFYVTY
jgi:hypothetical protein